jgi:hypothetical protein
MKNVFSSLLIIMSFIFAFGQTIPFNYEVSIVPKSVPNFPGVHSFAFGQANGKWLIIGGRRDGLHARQPNSSFPTVSNNTDIMVIDPISNQYWSASLNTLPTSVAEQLQATNMNFYQDADSLYILGGYA